VPDQNEQVRVEDNPARDRFEIHVDDRLAGFTSYRVDGPVALFAHTEIDPAFGGRGLGTRLVHGALDGMRERGLGVLPLCSFVRKVVAEEPRYRELLPAEQRARFGLPDG
jgi:uncharacterized protein